jgi:hypothetical protein
MEMRRPLPGDRTGPADPDFSDEGFRNEFPTLHEYLTMTKYDKGEARVTSTLLVFVENGVLRLCLNDRDNLRSAFYTGETLATAMASLEMALLSERVEWKSKAGYARPEHKTPF